jgi:ribosomal protein S18 acetylase RimI-like enzyme
MSRPGAASPPVRLRRLAPRDWRIVQPLVRQFYAHFGYRYAAQVQGRAFRQLLGDAERGLAWLIEMDGAVAGYVVLALGWSIEYGGRVAVVDEIFVGEELRGRGIGRAALSLVKGAARRHRIRRLFLEVESYNRGAKRLYTSLGFLDTRRTLMTAPLV